MVESYITRNLGPLSLLRDLAQTAIWAALGPRLPRLVEAMLIAQAEQPKANSPSPTPRRLALALGAALVFGAGLWLGHGL